MAVDKLVDSAQLNSDLTDIADAIRAKTGKSASMEFPNGFVSEIGSISGGGGGSGKLETGTFTITADAKNYTINHSLGVVPDFCVIYPIDVPTATNTYRIAWEVVLRDIGQSDYNISQYTATMMARHVMWQGASYNLTANPSGYAAHNATGAYAGDATITTFVVGGANAQASGGSLSAGTYGYILGVIS